MSPTSRRIAILGAGLQGACLALELASRGAQVDLYERNDSCVAEASAHNEGKVHLGFVYAYDQSFDTARLMASAAIRFEPLLRRWIGADVERLITSSPFFYAVHRKGLVTPDAFECHARKVSAYIATASESNDAQYFGSALGKVPERLRYAELVANYRTDTTAAVFRTTEISIDPETLAQLVRLRLASEPAIRCLVNRTVLSVYEGDRHLAVTSAQNGHSDEEGYDFVVNTLWSTRLGVDAQLGLAPDRPWSFRFKYFVRSTSTGRQDLPSTTIVLGPFGDIVNYADGSIYLSWYPVGVRAWSRDLVPPTLPSILHGPETFTLRQGIVDGLASVVPGVAELDLQDFKIKGGWIFAWGDTDIDEPRSELHQRSKVGTHRRGNYLSINTGKLTLAPLFAEQAANRILAESP